MAEQNDNSKLIDLGFIAKLAETAAGLRVQTPPGLRPFILLPNASGGFDIEFLEPNHKEPLPDFIKQGAGLADLASFIAYFKKFQTNTSVIFATTTDSGAQFEAVLDYHEGGVDGKPRRAAHVVEYSPEYSPEFKAWRDIDGKTLTQDAFLEHLRRNGADVTSMDDADLIELASNLDFQVEGQYSNHTERTKGGMRLLFNQVVEGSAQMRGQQVDVPTGLVIKVPVFVNGAAYEIGADILYRPQGTLRIIIELKRAHLVVRKAVADLVAEIAAGTDTQPFLGERD